MTKNVPIKESALAKFSQKSPPTLSHASATPTHQQPHAMTLVLHGFTAADGWVISGETPIANPAGLLMKWNIGCNADGEAYLSLETYDFQNVHRCTHYTYNDTSSEPCKGSETERRFQLYDRVIRATNNLVGSYRVTIEPCCIDSEDENSTFLPSYDEKCTFLTSLEHECLDWEDIAQHKMCEITLRLPARLVHIHVGYADAKKIFDNMKWSRHFKGILFRDYGETAVDTKPVMLQHYKELRNVQFTFVFRLWSDGSGEWVESMKQNLRNVEKVKEMFQDTRPCNSLKFVLRLPDQEVEFENVYTTANWM
jgi:hypothetical protein